MAQASELESLVGSWRLVSLGVTLSDTRERIEPYGKHPVGYMVLSDSGRIMFLFTTANRQVPETNQARAELFDSMTAYTGHVRIDAPGRLTTRVDLAWNPGFEGDQIRFFTLEGDRLTIQSAEQTHPQYRERLLVADVVWVRESIAPNS